MNDYFVYVSQIPGSGSAGQNKFEQGIIKGLLRKEFQEKNIEIKIFSATTSGESSEDDRLVLLPLRNKNYSGYLLHQFRLFFSLGIFFWRQRKKKVAMFIRYHDAMIAPLVLAFIFKIRFSMRTGPVLPSLASSNKNPGPILFNSIKWVFGLFCSNASAIITVTENIKKGLLENYKLDPDKIIVVPNAVDTDLFFPEPSDRNNWKLPENEFIFGFVGTMDNTQGLDTIIQALGFLKKKKEKVPRILMIGDGDYRSTLESMSEKLDVADSLTWTGNLPHDQVRSAINACDMMLAPVSIDDLKWRGSSSLKLWEYLACDKPVLSTKFSDFEFLEKFNLGKMVAEDNMESWAKALTLEGEKGGNLLHGEGKKFVTERNSYNSVVEKLISISFDSKSN